MIIGLPAEILKTNVGVEGVSHSVQLRIDVAHTPEDLMEGFSGRDEPEDEEGILFVPVPSVKHIHLWMKDVPFGLDAIFLDEAWVVDSCITMPAYTTETFSGASRFALEVPEGFCARYGVGPGAVFNITDSSSQERVRDLHQNDSEAPEVF